MSFFLIASSVSIGQNIQLGTYIGHQTPASLELYFGKFRTLSGTSYGGTLSFGQGPGGTNMYRNSWIEHSPKKLLNLKYVEQYPHH